MKLLSWTAFNSACANLACPPGLQGVCSISSVSPLTPLSGAVLPMVRTSWVFPALPCPASQMGDSLFFWLSPYLAQDRKTCFLLLVQFLFGSLQTIFTLSITHSCSLTLTIQDCRTPGHVGSPLLPSCIFPEPDTVVRHVCHSSAQLVRLTVLAYLLDEAF